MNSVSRKLHLLAIRPEALRVHFDLGMRCWEARDLYGVARHRAAVGLLPEGGVESTEFMLLRWRELWLEGEQDGAVDVARMAADRFPDDIDTTLDLCDLLSQLGRYTESLDVLLKSVERHRDDPDLWYELALCAEALQQWDARREAFQQVWDLEHDREPQPRLYVSEEAFEQFAHEAIASLPPTIQQAIGNVAILIEDYPERWVVEGDIADPRVLGVFSGSERYANQAGADCVADSPSRIHLFRWNIERTCGSPEDVAEQVARTIRHEVGAYLGLEEDDLSYMGLG